MGCGHYFVVDLVEELVDEGGSRSASRAHEHESSCKEKENELKSCHNKTNWANFVWMQDSWMLLKSDSISWRKTLQNSHNSQMQWPVVSTLLPRDEEESEPKGWIRGNTKIGPVLEVTTCCLHGKYGVEIRIMSTKQRQFSLMRLILHADQRPKRNHKDENLPPLAQELYLLGKEFGPMLSQENIQSPIMKCRRN